MKILSAEFVTSAVKADQYPELRHPEIAFAGRSNVGKSSLINVLVNRKRLVKTSSTPGRTQLVNFFDINEAITFVDLPGYGYAKAPKRVVREWGPMVERYLAERRSLKGALLLIDIRRSPREDEFNLVEWFRAHGIPFRVVLTKSDKFSNNKRQGNVARIAKELGMKSSELIPFSALSRSGRDDVWQAITDLVGSPADTATEE
ncbi:putative GTP-binding protein EngB [Desulfoluna limicola]|uniref:Probable GTP-binding protein EngB n=1 Tax=Desulfoluna limicola TaxID=2810562 RepID=A0ABM7PKF9_9BACT|nr:ribosome biogenesis GTP-binding protein YihA/YsxC [Desulfoluna limicola]BCS97828.1 putative GTP-binding protein EngB [Desulfoluna limicola]